MNVSLPLALVASLGAAVLSGCNPACPEPVVPAYADPCDGGACINSYCAVDAGVSGCAPLKPLGAQCTRAPECEGLTCAAGVCVAPPPVTCSIALEIGAPSRPTS